MRVSGRLRRAVLPVVAGWTLYGVLLGVLWAGSRGMALTLWPRVLLLGLATGWFWAAATPVILLLTQRFAPRRRGWPLSLLAHGVLIAGIVLLATTLRQVLVVVMGLRAGGGWMGALYYWLDYNIITYLVIVIAGRALELHEQYVERATRSIALGTQLARARLEFLQKQLQPHFLFNTLNATAELTHEAPTLAARTLRQLRALLSSVMALGERERVPLREELEALLPYLEIQRIRFSDWLVIEQNIEPAALDVLVPPLLLQPLVENAIQHGLAGRRDPGRVTITARVRGDELFLTIRDDGAGYSPRQANRQGVGIRNTEERLRALYREAHSFSVRAAAPHGTLAEIVLPALRGSSPVAWQESPTPGEAPGPDRTRARTAAGDGRSRAPDSGRPDGRHDTSRAPHDTAAAASGMRAAPSNDRFATQRLRAWWRAARPALRPGPAAPASPAMGLHIWLRLVVVWVFWGMFWTQQMYMVDRLTSGRVVTLWQAGRADLVSAAVWAVFTPVVLLLARVLRIEREHWRRRVAGHILLALGFSVLQFKAVQLFGVLPGLRLLSPSAINQDVLNVFLYAGLVTWSHAHDFAAWYHERDVAAARLEATLARTRWQSFCMDVQPDFLLRTLDATASIVLVDPRRAERIVVALADLMRGTLDTGGQAAVPLSRELALLRRAAEIAALRGGTDVRVSLLTEPDVEDVPVPNRLLRMVSERILGDESSPGIIREIVLRARGDADSLVIDVSASVPLSGSSGSARDWRAQVLSAVQALPAQEVAARFIDDCTLTLLVEAPGRAARTRERNTESGSTNNP